MSDRVLLTRRLPPPAADVLADAGFSVEACDSDDPPARPDLLIRARGVSAILATLTERVDAELLAAAGPGLRVVANFAVGYDNIDVAACRRAGVVATNTPDVLTDATADLTMALLLAVARRIVEGDQLARSGEWGGWTPTQLLGLELRGAVLGIIGAGRIGTAVAARAAAFGMGVAYCHPRVNDELERVCRARRMALDELLATADVVSLHVPMRPENRHMIGAAQISRMRAGAILINTARGPLIDEAALIAALQARRLAAAGLDVYEHEPRVPTELAELPNVVLLPHLGSATLATRFRMSQMAADNIICVLRGQTPPNPIT